MAIVRTHNYRENMKSSSSGQLTKSSALYGSKLAVKGQNKSSFKKKKKKNLSKFIGFNGRID